MNLRKECGSCMSWNKWKHDAEGRGLCDAKDWASTAQDGRRCKEWKGKKYQGEL